MSPICHQGGQIFAPVRPPGGPCCTRWALARPTYPWRPGGAGRPREGFDPAGSVRHAGRAAVLGRGAGLVRWCPRSTGSGPAPGCPVLVARPWAGWWQGSIPLRAGPLRAAGALVLAGAARARCWPGTAAPARLGRAGDGLPRSGGTWRWRRDGRHLPAQATVRPSAPRPAWPGPAGAMGAPPTGAWGFYGSRAGTFQPKSAFTPSPLPEKISRKISGAKNRPPPLLFSQEPAGNFSG